MSIRACILSLSGEGAIIKKVPHIDYLSLLSFKQSPVKIVSILYQSRTGYFSPSVVVSQLTLCKLTLPQNTCHVNCFPEW